MAKELPYFKFIVADWLTGDIVYESFAVQGLFINICAIYWQRNGILSIDDINKRFKNPVELADLSGRYFSLHDGFISIKFLNEQFEERKRLSFTNSNNGSLGGKSKALKTLGKQANAKRTLSEGVAKRGNKEKKRKEKILFSESNLFDKNQFVKEFSDWSKDKQKYYYDSLLAWSEEGNKKVNWKRTAEIWASRDEKEGKIKFNNNTVVDTRATPKGTRDALFGN